jgi:hypothetical protein
MSRLRTTTNLAIVTLALAMLAGNVGAQGKGKGHAGHEVKVEKPKPNKPGPTVAKQAHEMAKMQDKAAKEYSKAENHAAKEYVKEQSRYAKDVAKSNKQYAKHAAHAALMSAAVAHAYALGHHDYYRVEPSGARYAIYNRDGTPLLYLNEDEARELGRWRVGLVDNQLRDGAPSYCRTGAGHPVWGRQWCIDKGFGLGDYQEYRWGRTNDLGDWPYNRTVYQPSLTNTVLQSLLGTTAYNRLALHAVELGFLQPLTGRWVSQQTGPNLLLVNSGSYPVAEVVDTNRDFRWDDLLVALLLNR